MTGEDNKIKSPSLQIVRIGYMFVKMGNGSSFKPHFGDWTCPFTHICILCIWTLVYFHDVFPIFCPSVQVGVRTTSVELFITKWDTLSLMIHRETKNFLSNVAGELWLMLLSAGNQVKHKAHDWSKILNGKVAKQHCSKKVALCIISLILFTLDHLMCF